MIRFGGIKTMDENKEVVETQGSETKTYTLDEVNAMIEEGKKQAREEAKKSASKEFQKKMDESKKLSRMSEQERYEYELSQREQAILEKEKELALMENKNEASKILSEKGISLNLVDFVVKDTAEDTLAAINLLEKEFKKSVKSEVEKRLAGNTPKKGLPVNKAITKEDFMKMSFTELMELKNENPELYAELSK